MYKTILSLILIILFSFQLSAQQTKDDLTRLENGEDVNVLYPYEASFGLLMHSAGGFGIAYRRGTHITAKRKRMYEIEITNFKHPKEVKSSNSYFANSKGFIYGKLNSVLLIRPGLGYQNVIYQKSDKKSVEIRYSYFIGTTLAFAKPVYLEIKKSNAIIPSTERYNPEIHKQEDIFGKGPFFKGIEKTIIYPAAYAKLALSFEYADRYNALKAIETGAVVDVYPKALPIMAFNKKQQVFVSVYLKIIWGKKWF